MSEENGIDDAMELPEADTSKGVVRWIVVLLVIAAGVAGYVVLEKTGPKADKKEPPPVIPVVRVITVKSGDKQMYVSTQGRVEPLRTTQAASEVMGRVAKVDDRFKAGGVFKHNEVMLEIDDADYVSALANVEASLADAKLMLQQEEARAEQAQRDWTKLGRGKASDLVLRKPQIASAMARVAAAEAAREKAMRDLKRTKLRAPYDCRVLATYADMGSYITPGARLADLHSLNNLEVRLPVTMEELGYLKQDDHGVTGSEVNIAAELAGEMRAWTGKVIRSEGNVDRNTLTMHLVMKVEADQEDSLFPLPPTGLVVSADIKGRVIKDVIEIPRSALRADHTVLTLTEDGELKILPVKLARTMRTHVLVSSGLSDGMQLIVSPIEMPVDGMQLAIGAGQEEDAAEQP